MGNDGKSKSYEHHGNKKKQIKQNQKNKKREIKNISKKGKQFSPHLARDPSHRTYFGYVRDQNTEAPHFQLPPPNLFSHVHGIPSSGGHLQPHPRCGYHFPSLFIFLFLA